MLLSFPSFYPWSGGQASLTYHSLTTTQNALAIHFTFPKTGTLSRVGFLTGTVTAAADIAIRIETLASYLPTGTLYHASGTGTQASPAASTWYRPQINGATGIPVTAGDRAAIMFNCPSGSPNLQIGRSLTGTSSPGRFLLYSTRATTTWAAGNSTIAPIALEYSDGSAPWIGSAPVTGNPGNTSIHTTTTPDEAGLRITLPFGGRCIGAYGIDNGAGFPRYRLYSGTTQLATTRDYSQNEWNNYGYPGWYLWNTPVDLTPGTYIVSLCPHTTGTTTALFKHSINQAAYAEALGLTSGDGEVTRTDAGSWSSVDTFTIPMMGLVFDSISSGSGHIAPPLFGV